ncbi:hypothetical protein BC833DRAFT_562103 [Globomyces pollinis-pini]|nr:hypothetical protein BC833DRAFT_562103 [Globomyces pollinis-pini]
MGSNTIRSRLDECCAYPSMEEIMGGLLVCGNCGIVCQNQLKTLEYENSNQPHTLYQKAAWTPYGRSISTKSLLYEKLELMLFQFKLPNSYMPIIWERSEMLQSAKHIGYGRKGYVALSCCMYLTMKEHNIPTQLKSYLFKLEIDQKEFSKIYFFGASLLNLNRRVLPNSMKDHVKRICRDLKYSHAELADLCKYLVELVSMHNISGLETSIATSIVLVALEAKEGIKCNFTAISTKHIMAIYVCSLRTIQRHYASIHDAIYGLLQGNSQFSDVLEDSKLYYKLLYDIIMSCNIIEY